MSFDSPHIELLVAGEDQPTTGRQRNRAQEVLRASGADKKRGDVRKSRSSSSSSLIHNRILRSTNSDNVRAPRWAVNTLTPSSTSLLRMTCKTVQQLEIMRRVNKTGENTRWRRITACGGVERSCGRLALRCERVHSSMIHRSLLHSPRDRVSSASA